MDNLSEDLAYKPASHFARYLRETNFKHPEDHLNGPHQFAFQTKLPWFDWVKTHPDIWRRFNMLMTSWRAAKEDWVNLLPVEETIMNGANEQSTAPLIVDVGGGYGHDLTLFRKSFPNAKGLLVLEDQSEVIDGIPDELRNETFQTIKYDFFQPQPIKGKVSVDMADRRTW